MGEMIARYKPGQNVPVFAGSQITAGRFVKITGAKTANGDYPAAHCGSGQWSFGVAEQDSAPTTYPATATDRRVNCIRPGAIARVTAGAAVSAGDDVQSNAAGKAITRATTGLALGKALTAAGADGDVIEVELYGGPSSGQTGEAVAQAAAVADAGALTATNPSAVVASSGEATAADLTTTQGVETCASALVVDVTAIHTTLNALLASLRASEQLDT